MSISSNISLGSLRQQCKEISDNENNGAITDEAWNSFITNSYKKLYDMLVAAYGNDYYLAETYEFQTNSNQGYTLPDGTATYTNTAGDPAEKFYKMLGVDLQYSASPSGWVSLRRFEMIDRNRYGFQNVQGNWSGNTNLRYRIQGNQIYFAPLPSTGQTVRLFYVPAPTNLQYRLIGAYTSGSTTIGLSGTTGIYNAMNVSGTGIQSGSLVTSVTSNSVEITPVTTAARNTGLVSIWSDATEIDGISGWEQFVIFDAALKAQGKQENDTSWIAVERETMKQEIESMAEARDAGQAFHVSDVLAISGNGWDSGSDFGSGAW